MGEWSIPAPCGAGSFGGTSLHGKLRQLRTGRPAPVHSSALSSSSTWTCAHTHACNPVTALGAGGERKGRPCRTLLPR